VAGQRPASRRRGASAHFWRRGGNLRHQQPGIHRGASNTNRPAFCPGGIGGGAGRLNDTVAFFDSDQRRLKLGIVQILARPAPRTPARISRWALGFCSISRLRFEAR